VPTCSRLGRRYRLGAGSKLAPAVPPTPQTGRQAANRKERGASALQPPMPQPQPQPPMPQPQPHAAADAAAAAALQPQPQPQPPTMPPPMPPPMPPQLPPPPPPPPAAAAPSQLPTRVLRLSCCVIRHPVIPPY